MFAVIGIVFFLKNWKNSFIGISSGINIKNEYYESEKVMLM